MFEKLKIKIIYYDFLDKVDLTKEQIAILEMLIKKEKIVKIAFEMGMSERNAKYEVQRLKRLYKNYIEMEKTKFEILTN